MASEQLFAPAPQRRRSKKSKIKVDKAAIAQRVLTFYTDDLITHQDDREARVQREAKIRLWREGKDWPWPDASDVAIPDIAEKCLRAQDTLHNAVLANRPAINAEAVNKADMQKQDTIDKLLDAQLFIEQPGEDILAELTSAFVDDGLCTAEVVWMREKREVTRTVIFDAVPPEVEPPAYFASLIAQKWPTADAEPKGKGWDWKVTITEQFDEKDQPRQFDLSFYTRDGDDRVEMCWQEPVVTFEGPKVQPYDYDDVLAPAGVANLQPPTPSNPKGSPHVILRSHPTLDTITKRAKDGYYDISADDLQALASVAHSKLDDGKRPREALRDDLQGVAHKPGVHDKQHGTLTLLKCYDLYDVDGDGLAEDVVWWVIEEAKLLVKTALVSDVFPSTKGRRPIAEATYIPVRGRRVGLSLPELVEGLHDVQKAVLDQAIDASTLQNMPWGAYRPQSAINPQAQRLEPGMLMPLERPSEDLFIPTFQNNALAAGINILTLMGQWEERLTMVTDTAFGQVPAGQSSALRTSANMQALLSQGAARPERVLRRYFGLLVQIADIMHTYNRVWLPKNKQIRLAGVVAQDADPFLVVPARDTIDGDYIFTFKASAFNSSREARIAARQQVLGMIVNPFNIQFGLVTPGELYRIQKEVIEDMGLDGSYIRAPNPQAALPRVLVEDVLAQIISGSQPTLGYPAEPGGWQEHLQKLEGFVQSDNLGLITDQMVVQTLTGYIQYAQQQFMAEQQQMMLAAQAFQQMGQQQGGPGRPAQQAQAPQGNPQISGEGEMLDERLPGAGGGANNG